MYFKKKAEKEAQLAVELTQRHIQCPPGQEFIDYFACDNCQKPLINIR